MGLVNNGKELQELYGIWHERQVSREMARYDAEGIFANLSYGLGHEVREMAGLMTGYAMNASALSDIPGGYRVDVYGLASAMEADGSAAVGCYARLKSNVGLHPGHDPVKLSKVSSGKWKVLVSGTIHEKVERRYYDDAADAVADFVGEVRRHVEPEVNAGTATFRIAAGSRMVAADVCRALAIAEEKYDPARRGEEASIGAYVSAPAMSL